MKLCSHTLPSTQSTKNCTAIMVKIIVGLMGGSVVGGAAKLSTADQLRALLTMLAKHKVKELDTARVYNKGRSEELLGEVNVEIDRQGFEIATKAPGFSPGSLSYDAVISNCNASLAALRQSQIDLYYFHGPDRKTPLEESCKAINDLYDQGKFRRFGVSNFRAAEVEEIVGICKKHNWIVPSVYQGGYNPLGRTMELKLLPVLRKHHMSFYAFSPLGGGFFSRPAAQLRDPPAGGRMDQMKNVKDLYVNDLSLELHDELQKKCEEAGVPMAVATLRWLMHHSPLNENDGILLGGSSQEQIEQNLKACEQGPLPQAVLDSFENMWKRISTEREPPPYSV